MKKHFMVLMLALCVVSTAGAAEEAQAVVRSIGAKMNRSAAATQRVIGEEICEFGAQTWRLQQKAIKGDEDKFKQRCDDLVQKWNDFVEQEGESISDKTIAAIRVEFEPDGLQISNEGAVGMAAGLLQNLKGMSALILQGVQQQRAAYQLYCEKYKGQGSDSDYSDSGSKTGEDF